MKACKWGNSQCDHMAKLFKSIWPSTATKTCPIIKDFCHSRIKILPNKNNIPQKLPKTFKILPKFAKSGHSGVARSIRFASNICKSILADSVQLSFKCHYLFISLGKNSFKTFISKFFLSFCVRRSVFSTSRITNQVGRQVGVDRLILKLFKSDSVAFIFSAFALHVLSIIFPLPFCLPLPKHSFSVYFFLLPTCLNSSKLFLLSLSSSFFSVYFFAVPTYLLYPFIKFQIFLCLSFQLQSSKLFLLSFLLLSFVSLLLFYCLSLSIKLCFSLSFVYKRISFPSFRSPERTTERLFLFYTNGGGKASGRSSLSVSQLTSTFQRSAIIIFVIVVVTTVDLPELEATKRKKTVW